MFPTGKQKRFVWLTKATYSEKSREIVLEFSSLETKLVKRFPFLPKAIFRLPKLSGPEPMASLLGGLDRKTFSFSIKGNSLIVTSSGFSSLKKVSGLLEKALNSKALLLAPERQFLCESNFSYFDCFRMFANEALSKCQFCLPKVKTGIDLESFPKTLELLLEKESSLGSKLSEKIILSNLLRQPLEKVPESKAVCLEQFLDALAFAHKQPLPCNPVVSLDEFSLPETETSPLPRFTEIDFSQVWPVLLTFPFYNLGPDSIDCGCCKPKSQRERTVLPSSLAIAEFSSDGIYFESSIPRFALNFHFSHPAKSERERFQSEWGMQLPPIGPLFSGQVLQIPVSDAQRLEAQGKCSILGFGEEIHWFCEKNESFLSKEISELNSKMVSIERIMRQKEKRLISSRGLAGLALLEKDLNYKFFRSSLSVLNGFFRAIPLHLCLPFSRHYDPVLANSISSVQDSVLYSFREFARQSGSRTVQKSRVGTLLESELCLATAKDFSKKEGIPVPQIGRKHKQAGFN